MSATIIQEILTVMNIASILSMIKAIINFKVESIPFITTSDLVKINKFCLEKYTSNWLAKTKNSYLNIIWMTVTIRGQKLASKKD